MTARQPDFAALNRRLLQGVEDRLRSWLPGGRFEGREYVVRNPKRADRSTGSFKINRETGSWADFATGDKGGDLVSLFAYLHNVSQSEAYRCLDAALDRGAQSHAETTLLRRVPVRPRDADGESAADCTLETYAAYRRLDPDFLCEVHVRDSRPSPGHPPRIEIDYLDCNGQLQARRYRTALAGSGRRFYWEKGAETCLYGLWRLPSDERDLILVEGESDCHVLWSHGYTALGVPGANVFKAERDDPVLAAFNRIFLVVESDHGGAALLEAVMASRIADRVVPVRFGDFKDVAELHLDDPGSFKTRFDRLRQDAAERSGEAEATGHPQADVDVSSFRSLLDAHDVLALFAADITGAGLVGEVEFAKLAYLAVTTRLLDRPVSLTVKGPSSAGKSFLVDTVLKFFPPDAYHALTAMSEKALIYSEEPLKHRMLVLCEAAGLAGETGEYLVRSLLSEGRLKYETVEKTSNGLKPRRIDKEGPTGLILTTTRIAVNPENETRMLSLTISDTPEQTREVLRSLAGGRRQQSDLRRWRDYQMWLASGPVQVDVPFAADLAELVDASSVRIRRDFAKLLALVEAHAILHRAHRVVRDVGRIEASLQDYRAVYELTRDLFSEAVSARVPPTVRETVQGVRKLAETQPEAVTNARVAEALGLDASAASRRLKRALQLGFVVDCGNGGGRDFRVGAPMPEDRATVPTPETLEAAWRERVCGFADKKGKTFGTDDRAKAERDGKGG